MHAYKLFIDDGYDVTIASPKGGKVEIDALSDPRDSSEHSKDDTISLISTRQEFYESAWKSQK